MGTYPFETAAEALVWLWDHPIFQHNVTMGHPDGTVVYAETESLWESGEISLILKLWNPQSGEYSEDVYPGTKVWIQIETGPHVGMPVIFKYEAEHGSGWPGSLCTHDHDLDVLEPNQEEAILSLARNVWAKYGHGHDWIAYKILEYMDYEVPAPDPVWGHGSHIVNLLGAGKIGEIQLWSQSWREDFKRFPLLEGLLLSTGMLLEA